MFSRKHDSSDVHGLPEKWHHDYNQLLLETYQQLTESRNSQFYTYSELHQDELTIVTSLIHNTDQSVIPISIFVSTDLKQDQDYKKLLNLIVDLNGHLLDDILASDSWSDYSDRWVETELKNQILFYKITRENINLSLQANSLLNQKQDDQNH